jgi:hypothetical protein
MSEKREATEKLKPQVYRKGFTYDWTIETVQMILLMFPLPMGAIGIGYFIPINRLDPFAEFWSKIAVVLAYALGLVLILGAGFYMKYRRRNLTKGKSELNIDFQWMNPNSRECLWITTRPLILRKWEEIETKELFLNVYEAMTGVKFKSERKPRKYIDGYDTLTGKKIHKKRIEKILKDITKAMPKNFVWVLYEFENTFPGLKVKQDEDSGITTYEESDYLFSRLLLLTHKKYVEPKEIWDVGLADTQLMGCEDEDLVYKAQVNVWGIYEALGVPVCTVGLSRMHRFEMKQAEVTQPSKALLEFTLLMREALRVAGAELRAHHYAEAFDEMTDVNLDAGAGRRSRRAITKRERSGMRLWIEEHPGLLVALIVCAIISIVAVLILIQTGTIPVNLPGG